MAFTSALAIMALLAKRLPVIHVPKLTAVSNWYNVVYYRSQLTTVLAYWIGLKVS